MKLLCAVTFYNQSFNLPNYNSENIEGGRSKRKFRISVPIRVYSESVRKRMNVRWIISNTLERKTYNE